MTDPRDQQIDGEAIMMNLIAGGDEQIEDDDDGSQFLQANYEEIMQGSSPLPHEQQIVEQANTGEVYYTCLLGNRVRI
jgi:hypothetical protein